MMATKATGATVISLDSHPTWLAAQRRSKEIEAAKRRHPSFQSVPAADSYTPAPEAVVRHLHAL